MLEITLAGFNIDREIIDGAFSLLRRAANHLHSAATVSRDGTDEASTDLMGELTHFLDRATPTPETLSAAYARISRDPRGVAALRRAAREEVRKARRSNRTIVFGMGHFSVAEHAVFNFDVTGISRLAVEELEQRRLASFTEKSQRYITLEPEFVLPAEVLEPELTAERDALSKGAVEFFRFYHRAAPVVQRFLSERDADRFPAESRKLALRRSGDPPERLRFIRRELKESGISPESTRSTIEELKRIHGIAREDARYVLSLATPAQLGMTANARILEHTIRRFSGHPLEEVRRLGARLYEVVTDVAPSLVILADSEGFEELTGQKAEDTWYKTERESIRRAASTAWSSIELDRPEQSESEAELEPPPRDTTAREVRTGIEPEQLGDVILADWTTEPDVKVASALLQSGGRFGYLDSLFAAQELENRGRLEDFLLDCLRDLGKHDPFPREFEEVHFSFEIVMSSSCYAQFKRHRMMTLLPQPYDPALGFTIPESLADAGLEKEYSSHLEKASGIFSDAAPRLGRAAEYFLTNGHRRRIRANINARELAHISRLRMDEHAQWDIRRISSDMISLARRKAPAVTALFCGKDAFDRRRSGLFENQD